MCDSKRNVAIDVTRRDFIKCSAASGLFVLAVPAGLRGAADEAALPDLAALFVDPPDSARPWVLWHWMNGHVTREGITLDLEAMKRAGIGGFINFDAGTGIPKGPVEYLSQEWFALKQHAAREAARLGLEFGMHNCPGWSSSGGPWITPELAMQQLTWSEDHVEGGARVEVALPKPFHTLDHYRDVAVIAYPSLRGEASLRTLLAGVASSSGAVAVEALNASDLRAVVVRPAPAGGPAWLQLEFREPYQAAGISFIGAAAGEAAPGGQPPEGFGRRNAVLLEASDEGTQFRQVARIGIEGGREAAVAAATFPAVTARYFRLSTPGATSYSQVRFATVPRFEDVGKRTNAEFNGRGLAPMSDPGGDVVALDQVIDASEHLDASGVLRWQAPAGRWTILRFGFTPLGTLNRSAPDTGVGLECDKYRADAIAFHFDKMMQPLLPLLKPLADRGQMWLMVDSYEVGMQNWTPGFEGEFRARNDYGLVPYLPAMTGRVVGTVDTTDRVLWDLRRTQADLLADRYYGKLASLAHQHGMKLVIEPYDRGPMDEMQIGSRADANMGEFWQGLSSIFQNNLTMRRTPKLAAAIAHVNGQRVAGAESFTGEPESSKWQEHPFAMKTRGDENFVAGINRLMVHSFTHQPHPTAAPAMTMGPWGSHVERTTTWWEPGRAWFTYLARCQSLLQQGLFVADLAYFTGEDAGVYTKVQRDELTPAPPEGHDYDLVNAEVLFKARIAGGRIVLPDGMSYRVLVLQQYPTITLALLRRLHAMVRQGMVLVGARPHTTPSLREHPSGEAEFTSLCDELWGRDNPGTVARTLGQGRVFWGQPLTAVFEELKLPRDVEVSSESGDAPITWIHRKAGDTDLYFLANGRRTHERLVCTFRVDGRTPELWDATTGARVPAAVYASDGGRVRVGLDLPPAGSIFVVFRSPAPEETVTAIAKDGTEILSAKAFPAVRHARHAAVVNDFAVTLWAKPECSVMLSTNNFMEGVKDPWTDQYAIYPPPGHALYGAGHLACGLAIGRNGVAVWERGQGEPVFALGAPARLSGWTHVAVVYRAGVPAVYVGGALVARGEQKHGDVHPGTGPAFLADGASYYNGDMTEPVVHEGALAEEDIARVARVFPGRPTMWDRIVEPLAARSEPGATGRSSLQLRIWENGDYQLTTNRGRSSRIVVRDLAMPVGIAGPWRVEFPPGTGAPDRIDLPELASLHLHPVEGVRHFSGIATYRAEFPIAAPALAKDRALCLDLGHVEVVAEVMLNGKAVGILWARPLVADITSAARAGTNVLEVKVTNLWPNRLIGDEQHPDEDTYRPGAGGSGFASLSGGAIQALPEWYRQGRPKPPNARVAFTTWKHYTKDSPLLESGLVGPVVLRSAVVKPL
jgi:hypothetical protein